MTPDKGYRQPVAWDTPHSDPPETPAWHPVFLAWVAVDILHLLRSYVWHKHRSLRAERWAIEVDLVNALQGLDAIKRQEGVTRYQRERAEMTRRNLLLVADELGIESHHIDRHRPGEVDDAE